MVGFIGKKIGMTSTYNQAGNSIPCTILKAGPCTITQIKEIETDQYSAIQLAYDEKKPKNTTQPLQKHFDKANTTPKKKLVEFRNFRQHTTKKLQLGDVLQASDLFQEGDKINITANSKGKGFQGVVKRHGFHGVGQSTHGQKDRNRAPGSIGAGSSPSRVFKGMKMAGRMGNDRKTIQNLQIIKIIPQKNLLIVKGSIPGPPNAYLTLKKK